MGAQIALVFAQAEFRISLVDLSEETLARAPSHTEAFPA